MAKQAQAVTPEKLPMTVTETPKRGPGRPIDHYAMLADIDGDLCIRCRDESVPVRPVKIVAAKPFLNSNLQLLCTRCESIHRDGEDFR